MKRVIIRVFAILLAVLLTGLTAVPVFAAADEDTTYPEEFYWDKAGEDADNGYKAYAIPFGQPLKIPPDPERSDRSFLGWKDWYTDSFVNLAEETMNAYGRRFYAVWGDLTVMFRFYVDGNLLTVTENVVGQSPIHPRLPEKPGCTFAGWSPKLPEVTPNEEMSFNAVFKADTYIATLLVDDEVYMEIPYTYGQKSIDLPAVPKKAGYTGAWESYSLVIGGVTIRAIYTPIEPVLRTFRFYVDGALFTTLQNVVGEAFAVPRTPMKDGFNFMGWSPKTPQITPDEDMDFNAVFEPCTYIATLVVDGETYMEIPYTYGQKSIDLPAVPKKHGYSGAWEGYSLVIGGVTIRAIYTPCTYIATLLVDGEVYMEIPYTYGQKSIDLPDVPPKTGYTGYWESYTLGLDGVTIKAIYKPTDYTKRCMTGDAGGDGMVTVKDVAELCRYLAGGWDVQVHEPNADVNGDGVVDLRDVVLLRRYLAGWGVQLYAG